MIKLVIILRTNIRPRSRGLCIILIFFSNYVRSGSNAGKQRPENVGAGVVVRLLAVYGGSARLCCRATISCGLDPVYGGLDVAALTSRCTWYVNSRERDISTLLGRIQYRDRRTCKPLDIQLHIVFFQQQRKIKHG